MYQLFVFAAFLAYASAGLIPLDDGLGGLSLGGLGGYGSLGGLGGLGGIALAPKVAYAAPTAIAVKAGATSYQNNNLLSLHPTVVTKAVAASPIITKVAAPIGLAAPAVSVLDVGHLGLGGLGGLGLGGYGGYGGLSLGLGH